MGAVMAVLIALPDQTSLADDIECQVLSEVATLNPFPVTYTGEACKDYPVISARLANGSYPSNATEASQPIFANAGDEVVVRMYIHNGAAENLNDDQTTARDVRVTTTIAEDAGGDQGVFTSITANNTNTIGGLVNIMTTPGHRLVPVPGSGQVFDYQARVIEDGLTVANRTVELGDMQACFRFSQFITFRLRVEAPSAPQPTFTATPTPTPTPPLSGRPAGLTCDFIWDAPTTPDGRGIRRAGEQSRVRMEVRGATPMTNLLLTNVNLNDSRAITGTLAADPNGIVSGFDATLIRTNEYTVGIYETDLKDLSNGQIVECRSFVIVAQAPTPTPTFTPTPTPTPSPTVSGSPAPSPSTTPTATPSVTPSPSPTVSGSPTPSPSTTPTPNTFASYNIEKLARNLTTGTGKFTSVSARPSDTIEFTITVRSTGNAPLQNTRVFDILPNTMTYISGSTMVDNFNRADGITSGEGILLGNVVAGQTMNLTFRAQIVGESTFGFGNTPLTNQATVTTANAGKLTNFAVINVFRDQTTPTPTPGFQLQVQKLGRNITRGETIDNPTVSAAPGDNIAVLIKVMSFSSTQVNNVIVQDILPAGLSYVPGTTSLDGNFIIDGLTGQGINIGSLQANQERLIRFHARLSPETSFNIGTSTIFNHVQVRADLMPTINAQLPINIFRASGTVVAPIQTGKGPQIGKAAGVPTGGETILFSGILGAITAGGWAIYQGTPAAKRREVMALISRHRQSGINFV